MANYCIVQSVIKICLSGDLYLMVSGHARGAVPAFKRYIAQRNGGEDMVSPYLPRRFFVQLRNILNNRGDTLPAANAERGSTIFEVIAPQLVHQREGDTSATCRKWMPDGDSSTIDIRFVAIQPKLFLDREILRRERFIDFYPVKV